MFEPASQSELFCDVCEGTSSANVAWFEISDSKFFRPKGYNQFTLAFL